MADQDAHCPLCGSHKPMQPVQFKLSLNAFKHGPLVAFSDSDIDALVQAIKRGDTVLGDAEAYEGVVALKVEQGAGSPQHMVCGSDGQVEAEGDPAD